MRIMSSAQGYAVSMAMTVYDLRDIANSPIGCRMFAHGYKMLQDIAATYCNCIEHNNTSESCAKVISHIESVQILT